MAESSRYLFDPERLSDQEQSRLHNLEQIKAAGIDPFPARVRRTHTIAQARALFDGDSDPGATVSVCGRLKRIRIMGKMSFADLEDGSGQIQIVVRRDNLPDGWYNDIWKKYVDLGDFVGVTGPLVTTKTGEQSVEATDVQFLSKALKPMPDKWHGVRDRETRYRRRYVDLLANPEVRDVFVARAKTLAALRRYLDSEGFLEVETPILQPIYGGAAARPFVTHHNQLHQDLYLRISFELYLKRLLVGMYDAVYEIGRDFRNEGVSFKHNPEFTQLEFYQAYTDYHGMMDLTEHMVAYVAEQVTGSAVITFEGSTVDLTPPWSRLTLRDAIRQTTGIDYVDYPEAPALHAAMKAAGVDAPPHATWGKLVDTLLGTAVEPTLIQPTFILDYPRDISPLAKTVPGDESHVERFEMFIGGMEMGNAFTELNNPVDQEARFMEMGRLYAAEDELAMPIDEDYLRAMRYGMPPSGGCGIGVDRLVMLLTDKSTIREVLLYPHLRER